MPTDNPSLLAAVLAEPADDGPRLALADWLEENGQPERAEFIRAGCALAGVPPCPKNWRCWQHDWLNEEDGRR